MFHYKSRKRLACISLGNTYLHEYLNMRASQVTPLLLLLTIGLGQSRYTDEDSKTQCKLIEEIPMCAEIGYSNTGLPNILHQDNVDEINSELESYNALIRSNCSNALIYLLCSVYAPFCFSMYVRNVYTVLTLPPCQNLCKEVEVGCRATVEQANLPTHLDCSKYPKYGGLCFGPSDPSTLPPIEHPTTREPLICDYKATEIGTNSAIITTNKSPTGPISCTPPILNITVGETIQLSKLDQDTHYNCTIQQDTATDHTCTVELTTLPTLSIQLRNNTPNIDNNSIQLDFETNREVTKLECQLLLKTDNIKKDCRNGTVLFEGLSPGFYTIRIRAETGGGEKVTLRVRARVLEGPGYCTVNLINRQWTLDGDVLRVWFEGHPRNDQFECKVDKKLFDCDADPLTGNVVWTVPLTKGSKYKVQISPKNSEQCNQKRYSRTITVTV